jgi:hypothetical protein
MTVIVDKAMKQFAQKNPNDHTWTCVSADGKSIVLDGTYDLGDLEILTQMMRDLQMKPERKHD